MYVCIFLPLNLMSDTYSGIGIRIKFAYKTSVFVFMDKIKLMFF